MSDLYLEHHGIKGQKWGVRRFQNEDGSLTAAGKQRYSEESNTKFHLTDKQKKYIKIGVAVAGTALLMYGSYKLYQKAPANHFGIDAYARSNARS